jgi:hypothetical protein
VWTNEDRLAALVWKSEQDALCGGCGNPVTESMAPENELAYVAEPFTCHACKVKDLASSDASKEGDTAAGVYFTAHLKED